MTASNGLTVQSLYQAHHSWLHHWLHWRLGDDHQAADLAHDVFLRLLTKPPSTPPAGPAQARAYLKTVASNLCVDFWRRREIERAWLQELALRPELHAPSPEQQAIVVETLLEVERLLAGLPGQTGLAFIMAQVQGLSYREIAGKLHVSERTVKKYMAQAMLQCALFEAGLT